MGSTCVANEPRLTFITIPSEIRIEIYKRLFSVVVVSASSDRAGSPITNALRACRLCCDEAKPTFLQTVCFEQAYSNHGTNENLILESSEHAQWPDLDVTVSPQHRIQVRHLRIMHSEFLRWHPNEKFPGLATLTLMCESNHKFEDHNSFSECNYSHICPFTNDDGCDDQRGAVDEDFVAAACAREIKRLLANGHDRSVKQRPVGPNSGRSMVLFEAHRKLLQRRGGCKLYVQLALSVKAVARSDMRVIFNWIRCTYDCETEITDVNKADWKASTLLQGYDFTNIGSEELQELWLLC